MVKKGPEKQDPFRSDTDARAKWCLEWDMVTAALRGEVKLAKRILTRWKKERDKNK